MGRTIVGSGVSAGRDAVGGITVGTGKAAEIDPMLCPRLGVAVEWASGALFALHPTSSPIPTSKPLVILRSMV